ncbi:hypothetical protein [Pleurocapsa sp. PCC 7319]|uniref:hypothetical protein n=1 Tax=Pleurocapsa sp. PCC 7319 TaxID=118161 RepID=UPI000347CCFF|nr:hypothetical protein [Pleurocapsa sp. PCC 7319]
MEKQKIESISKRLLNLIYIQDLGLILRFVSVLLGGKLSVKLDKPLQEFNRIIEIGSTKVRFAHSCLNTETNNYLGLLTKDISTKQRQNEQILTIDRTFSIKENNADILILSDTLHLNRLWFFHEYRHTQYLFYTPINFTALFSGLSGLWKNILLKRIQVVGFSVLEDDWGTKQPTLIIKVLKRFTPNARRYISPVLGVEGFFKILTEKQVRYTILRWFEDLPAIMPDEDIDMLVADEDVEIIELLLQKQPGIIPCDLYTVSGLPGTAYKNMAYYPPLLAEKILQESITFRSYFRIPNREIHFFSLAYHAIYHKGLNSGIPISVNDNKNSKLDSTPEHEYTQILKEMAQSLNIEIDITLESLHEYLSSINWRPSQDTLARLDSSNIWLQEKYQSILDTDSGLDANSLNIKGLAVFFVRRKALELKLEHKIIELLVREGFNLIESKVLTSEEVKQVKYKIRGGNWGKGPWPDSGGDPTMVLVTVDLMPLKPSDTQLAKQPHLSNARILIKNKIRDIINSSLYAEQRCNIIHSSDNEQEAWNYLQIAIPENCIEIKHKIGALHHDFLTMYPIKKELTRFGRRAKLEVIEYQNKLAIKKTFRPGCERFCRRELLVYQSFGERFFAISSLIDYSSNYLIYPYYNDILQFQINQNRLLPLSVAKQAIETINFFYEQGYSLLDFNPANIIVDRDTGFKVIDFEFLYQYENRPDSLEQCYELVGITDDFHGDKPNFESKQYYEDRWKRYVGLSLKSLIYDPTWLQYIKRLIYAITYLPIRSLKNRINGLLSDYNLNFSSLKTLIKTTTIRKVD